MTAPALQFKDVVKEYRHGVVRQTCVRALNGVSLRVEPGEVVGLLGPNRAGKTTLVKLLLSLCHATSGRVERLGRPVRDRVTLARIGYVHENQAFPRYLTARALLQYYGALSLLPESTVRQRVPQLLELVGLADRGDEPIAHFSKGMVQRLGIAQALVNDPELLVLDEPSEGLDLKGRQLIREVLAKQQGNGRTVLFVSHLLNEVEQLCNRIAVLVEGKLAYFGPVAPLLTEKPGGKRTLEAAVKEFYDRKQQ